MSGKIFKQILDAILIGRPYFLLYCDVGQEELDQVMEGLRNRMNSLEPHSFRWQDYLPTPASLLIIINKLRQNLAVFFDKILKIIMPSRIHESPGEWMHEMLQTATARVILPEIFGRTMRISGSPGLWPIPLFLDIIPKSS